VIGFPGFIFDFLIPSAPILNLKYYFFFFFTLRVSKILTFPTDILLPDSLLARQVFNPN
jgi:hypothetical protein